MGKKAEKLKHLNDELLAIGLSLTSEHNFEVLMEKIMLSAKRFTNADAGTVYIMSEDGKKLSFKVVHTDSLKIKMGGTGEELNWPDLQLYLEDGKPNKQMVAALCALEGKLLNFPDVYDAVGFNFEGTKVFDSSTGYRSMSMLVVPMLDREDKVIGVLQLLNKKDKDESVIAFTKHDEVLISSMGSLAAVAIQNNLLIKNLEDLLEAFITAIAEALEEKSIYTEHHIMRVAQIVKIISEAVNKDTKEFEKIHYTKEQLKELEIAAMLHDIGKIITPEYVVDKATRLETIVDRIEMISRRFELLKRDRYIEYLENISNLQDDTLKQQFYEKYQQSIEKIAVDKEFLISCNTAGYLSDDKIDRIKEIGKQKIILDDKEIDFLSENEIYNLTIPKGTLTNEERDIINNHVTVSYHMLQHLPFPDKYKHIPKLAGSHHKSVDGTGGYAAPELMGIPLEFEEKILAIADVFEALTSPERPYKKPFTLNETFKIMFNMVKEGHLDKSIIKFILDNNLHLQFAKEYLNESQIDEVNVQM